MSWDYDSYLYAHKQNVVKGYHWMVINLPHVISNVSANFEDNILNKHDESKKLNEEYSAYDAYFYGNNKSNKVVSDFNIAWLHHIHNNKHHWQYWILFDDELNGNAYKTIEMPYDYIVEMICDWWSFSFKINNLYEIFNWYDKHKDTIILHQKSRKTVEYILREIHDVLDKMENDIES